MNRPATQPKTISGSESSAAVPAEAGTAASHPLLIIVPGGPIYWIIAIVACETCWKVVMVFAFAEYAC